MKLTLERQLSLIIALIGILVSWTYFIRFDVVPVFIYLILYIIFVGVIYLFTRKSLAGFGFLALGLLVLNPSFIRLSNQMGPASGNLIWTNLLFLLAFYSFFSFLTEPSRLNLILACLFFALALFFEPQTILLAVYFLIFMVIFYLISVASDWQKTEPGGRWARFSKRALHYFRALVIIYLAGLIGVWLGFGFLGILGGIKLNLTQPFLAWVKWLSGAWSLNQISWSGFFDFIGPTLFIFLLFVLTAFLVRLREVKFPSFNFINYFKSNIWEFGFLSFVLFYFVFGLFKGINLPVFTEFLVLGAVSEFKRSFENQKPMGEILNANFSGFIRSFFLRFLFYAFAFLTILFLLLADLILVL